MKAFQLPAHEGEPLAGIEQASETYRSLRSRDPNSMVVMIPVLKANSSLIRIPVLVQVSAWVMGLLTCLGGMLNLVAEWSPTVATMQFLVLIIAPFLWMIERQREPDRHRAISSDDHGESTVWIRCWHADDHRRR